MATQVATNPIVLPGDFPKDLTLGKLYELGALGVGQQLADAEASARKAIEVAPRGVLDVSCGGGLKERRRKANGLHNLLRVHMFATGVVGHR